MWVARDKDNKLKMFIDKPVRDFTWTDTDCVEKKEFWRRDIEKYPTVHYASKDALYNPHYQTMYLDESLFPLLTWEDEPIEVRLIENNPIHKHICPHCGKIVKYYDSDIKTSYDCQPSSTLPDFGEEYIICPECKKLIYI